MSTTTNRGPMMDPWIVRTHTAYRRQILREKLLTAAVWIATAFVAGQTAWVLAEDRVRAIAAVMVASVGGV